MCSKTRQSAITDVHPHRALIAAGDPEVGHRLASWLEEDGFVASAVEPKELAGGAPGADLVVAQAPASRRALAALHRQGRAPGGPALVLLDAEGGALPGWPSVASTCDREALARAVADAFAAGDARDGRASLATGPALARLASLGHSNEGSRQVLEQMREVCGQALGADRATLMLFPVHGLSAAVNLGVAKLSPLGVRGLEETIRFARPGWYQGHSHLSRTELWASPIRCNGAVAGAIAIERSARRPLGRGALSFLITASALISAQLERQRLMATLEHTERLAILGELVAGVAHELNTPIGYVASNLGSLERLLTAPGVLGGEAAGEAQAMLTDCVQGMDRLASLTTTLRVGSRRASSEHTTVDLAEVAASTAAMLHGTSAVNGRLRLQPQGACQPVRGDPARLLQIVLNLVNNALHATRPRGPVFIRTGADEDGSFLEVVDEGPGIPAELAARIFDPFFTTKPPEHGTGLGLSLSLKIARDHGGDLTLLQTPGGGATFRLCLPAIGQRADSAPPRRAARSRLRLVS